MVLLGAVCARGQALGVVDDGAGAAEGPAAATVGAGAAAAGAGYVDWKCRPHFGQTQN